MDASVDDALAVAVQADGKIVVAGVALSAVGGAVARFLPDGTPDLTFGTQGVALPRPLGVPRSLAVDSSGRIVIGGNGVIRLTASGALDTSFGVSGLANVTIPVGLNAVVAPDGSIYALGVQAPIPGTGPWQIGVSHVTADGQWDGTFGMYGTSAMIPIAAITHRGYGEIALQADGKIVALGGDDPPGFVRYLANGMLDTTFGTHGVASITGLPLAMKLQADGRIVVVTAVAPAGTGQPYSLALSRFGSNGALDETFGTHGVVAVDIGATDLIRSGVTPVGLVLDADGSITVAGTTGAGDGLHETATLLRFTSAGAPDAAFGTAGRMTLALSRGNSALHAIAAQADGRVLLTGRAWTEDGGSDLAVVRLR
jgi:uncharacterized delta-60 repeat protein